MAKPKKKIELVSDDSTLQDLSDMTPMERFRLVNADRMSKKFPKAQHTTNAKFLVVPDLGNQWALGRVGYCMGRINYILASEGASKTSRLLHLCRRAMEQGGLAALVESEGELDEEILGYYLGDYAEEFQKNIYHPDTLEEGMEMSRQILKSFKEVDPDNQLVKVLGYDSVGGSVMRRALDDDREIGDNRVGGSGLFMSDAVKLIKHFCKDTGTLWVVLGQLREKIETGFSGPPKAYLEKVTGLGGKALDFETAYWEILQRQGTLKDADGAKEGFRTKSTFKKNKRGIQWREYFYDIEFYSDLSGITPTMNMLSTGSICGLKSKNYGSQGKRFWCEGLNQSESDRLPIKDMYQLIHSPENIGIFQKALDIRNDMSDMETTVSEEAEAGAEVPPPAAVTSTRQDANI